MTKVWKCLNCGKFCKAREVYCAACCDTKKAERPGTIGKMFLWLRNRFKR